MPSDSDSPLPVVHRDLVEALEGEASGAGVDSEAWKAMVANAIGDRSPREVGRVLGERYSQSVVGRALMVSIELVSAERFWSTVVPLISSRLRRDVKYEWFPVGPGVGRLVLSGKRATPPEVTLGCYDFFGENTRPRSRLEIVDCTEATLVFEVRWG